MIEKVGNARSTLARSSRRRKRWTASVIGTVQDQSRVGPSGDPASHLPPFHYDLSQINGLQIPLLG